MAKYLLWFAVVFAMAGLSSRYMPGTWYAALRKPPWNPPNWIFGPVWSVLYIAMASAAGMVHNRPDGPTRNLALGLFVLQLVLNCLWSYLFFGLQRPGAAFAEVCVMWCAIGACIAVFARVAPAAAWIMVPYLCWVSFASVLNGVVWRLNAV